MFPPDIVKRAMLHKQTAREIRSYTVHEPPVRGRSPREAECWEPGGCTWFACHWRRVWFACHWRRVKVPKPAPHEHEYGDVA